MNDRVQQLAEQCYVNPYEFDHKKFAELIVKECIYTLQIKVLRNGNTPENIRSYQHIQDLGDKFGITFPIDYNPDRNN